MPDIMLLLSCSHHGLDHTSVCRLGRIVEAPLSMSGRVTMLGLSRWTERSGSYRAVQRFFQHHHCLGASALAGDSPPSINPVIKGKLVRG